MSHWSVNANYQYLHVTVGVIFKDNVQKVILNTRSFWEFESATNEQTNKRTKGKWPREKYKAKNFRTW